MLGAFSVAITRFERGAPDRCPECGSYRLFSDLRPDFDRARPYVTLCESCGWEDSPASDPGVSA